MPSLLIRDIPDNIHDELVAAAETGRRSKEKHALFLIESGLRVHKPLKQVLLEGAKIHAKCKKAITMAEILAAERVHK